MERAVAWKAFCLDHEGHHVPALAVSALDKPWQDHLSMAWSLAWNFCSHEMSVEAGITACLLTTLCPLRLLLSAGA